MQRVGEAQPGDRTMVDALSPAVGALIANPEDPSVMVRAAVDGAPAFSIRDAARMTSGTVIEFDGRRSNGEVLPVEASFSGWQGTEGYQYGAILRDISVGEDLGDVTTLRDPEVVKDVERRFGEQA